MKIVKRIAGYAIMASIFIGIAAGVPLGAGVPFGMAFVCGGIMLLGAAALVAGTAFAMWLITS